jgi:type IV pilus assembly protein PilF
MFMRLDRLLVAALLTLVAGCVTTGTPLEKLPHDSKVDQAADGARVHTELAQNYLANGDLKGALEKLNKALSFDPNYVPAHTVMGVVYERINDLPNAELHYRRAEELDPKSGAANNNLGAFLCREDKVAEAETYFQKAVADPFYQTPDVALTNAGICELKGGNLPTAEADFRNAIVRNPQNGEALYQLANVLYLNKDAFRASAFIQRFDALGKPTPDAFKLGYLIESRLGNRDAALSYRQRLISQFPDSEQARSLDATASQ